MRPVRLHWPDRPVAPPADHAPALHPLFGVPARQPDRGTARLLLGDALTVADRLLHEGRAGSFDLVHLDPPFGSGADYARLRRLRLDGADVELALPAYGDDDGGDVAGYLDALYPVLQRCHRLLSPRGSLYLHLDFRRGPYVRLLLDEIFGADHLVNEIVWAYGLGGSADTRYQRKHDVIYFYARDPAQRWFQAPLEAATSSRLRGQPKKATDVWRSADRADGTPLERDWADALLDKTLSNRDPERTGYPTQKPLALATRIVQASLPPGGVALDLMAGSGTLGVAAVLAGRDVVLGDRGGLALDTARGRLVAAGAAVAIDSVVESAWGLLPATATWAETEAGAVVGLDALQLPWPADLVADDTSATLARLNAEGRGHVLLSAWGLATPDATGRLRTLGWWDGGALRSRGEVPRTIAVPPGARPAGACVVAVDVFGRTWRAPIG